MKQIPVLLKTRKTVAGLGASPERLANSLSVRRCVSATFALVALALLSAVAADAPAGFVYWSQGKPPASGPKGAKFENHALGISHRDKTGPAEVHENQTDIMVIQEGGATLIVGGELVDPKTIRPGELQGASIKDGVRRTLAPGDIVHIPYGMPHQMILEDGKQITYFVVKVNKP
jgi:mannose-6-phosphate isomerase-like protein (cupin superfamily)